ncbi:MAG TPA: glycosyltransferase family 4 protein [Polyangiaceae bacterium]|nr:glycosyltransferase family 4 protein [Polyangiaceae bacterium]
MKTLILAAGRFGDEMRAAIAAGREPRLDVFELQRVLSADVLDYLDVDASLLKVAKRGGMAATSAALAALGFKIHKRYDAVLTTGEDIGLPLAALLKTSSHPIAHTMIAHTLFPAKKRAFFDYLKVHDRIDRVLAYSTSEEQHMIERLGIARERVQRIYYQADQRFFCPDGRALEPDLLCAAGQLLRDYDCLIDAVRGLKVRVQIAAGSPWIDQTLRPQGELPDNVSWGKLNRYDLRELYRRSALAVVPIKQNDYQTGIATILEMMAMGKCVIATRTRGQTDTIIDGETGIYVPPGDSTALRNAIQSMIADPGRAAAIGQAARRFVEREAGLDVFVERIAQAVKETHAARSRA